MRDQGVNKAELARRLGWHYPQVTRLFDFDHESYVEQLEAGLAAVGREVVVQTAPSKMLAAVVASSSMPRSEITKKIWSYIKRNVKQTRGGRPVVKVSRSVAASALTRSTVERRRQRTAARKAKRAS
jgi:TRAP-type C4-dicarboxylate transport system permease large subunit